MIVEIKDSDYNDMNVNTFERVRKLVTKILSILNEYEVMSICTNIQVATTLQDSSQFLDIASPITINPSTAPYLLGQLAGVNIYVDPMMNWDDTRILETLSFEKERSIKIHKILTGEAIYDALEIKIEINSLMI